MQQVVVTIPIYKQVPDAAEVASLEQCLLILGNYPIVFFAPEALDTSAYLRITGERATVERFSDHFFENVSGYNRLLLDKDFYARFSQFEYLLIYQLDAFIFGDHLSEWCNKGYDYIGAPWVGWEWSSLMARRISLPRKILSMMGRKEFNMVGNGGFSLRKTSSFITNLKRFRRAVNTFTQNEDYFFSFYIPSYNPFFRIPGVEEALNFAFDENPHLAFVKNNNKLPMACHAWGKYPEFWQPYIGNNLVISAGK